MEDFVAAMAMVNDAQAKFDGIMKGQDPIETQKLAARHMDVIKPLSILAIVGLDPISALTVVGLLNIMFKLGYDRGKAETFFQSVVVAEETNGKL